jgi:hypothetical protein
LNAQVSRRILKAGDHRIVDRFAGFGFCHEDVPGFIATSEQGKFIMKYNPTYGDKQREAQKRKMEEKSRTSQSQAEAEKPTATAREREPRKRTR